VRLPKPVTIDYETHGIESRPRYPPIPVGVSIKYPGKKSRYYAWGHVEGNNCSYGEAKAALAQAYNHPEGLLFQNGKFDIDVSEVHMDLPIPEWGKIHDTMFLLFLDDPHQIELGLKPSYERYFGVPPDEQDAVGEWLIKNQPVPGVKISKSRQSEHYFGRYLAYAPGKLVGVYAGDSVRSNKPGDTDRTWELFELLYPKIVEHGMLAAYDRERELALILLEMERSGIAFDTKACASDIKLYEEWSEKIDKWIIKRIKAREDINLDSGDQVLEAMLRSGVADEAACLKTSTGKLSTSKESLLQAVNDKQLLGIMRYRAALKTCLGTFMKPWVIEATRSGGTISTNWNQVKSPSGDSSVGTRTGRLSASRFMNMPKEFNPIFANEAKSPTEAKKLPKCPLPGLPSLPMTRSYIIPFKGEVLIDRDYSQQEPRILAHFDGGDLMLTYQANPWIDFHDYAKAELENYGMFYDRKPVKNTNLGLIYGMGAPKLAVKNDMSVDEADKLKKAILKLYPGLKDMYTDMRNRAKAGLSVRTWGGREYFCEPPKIIQGRLRTFDYKLVNVLIQGSAADCTKEAIIRWWRAVKKMKLEKVWKLILSVHDQLTVSAPKKDATKAMELLRQCMQSVEFDVPMLSEGSTSSTNWAELIDYDVKGVKV
jgi:DNA polymerase I